MLQSRDACFLLPLTDCMWAQRLQEVQQAGNLRNTARQTWGCCSCVKLHLWLQQTASGAAAEGVGSTAG